MWVRPSHRGLGIAARLVDAVRDWAVDAGARELELWVADGNEAAARLYVRAGFVPTGIRQPLPSNPAIGEENWILALAGTGPLDRAGRPAPPAEKMPG
jgi:RimJ/RimL family protein N-acetyltransferase